MCAGVCLSVCGLLQGEEGFFPSGPYSIAQSRSPNDLCLTSLSFLGPVLHQPHSARRMSLRDTSLDIRTLVSCETLDCAYPRRLQDQERAESTVSPFPSKGVGSGRVEVESSRFHQFPGSLSAVAAHGRSNKDTRTPGYHNLLYRLKTARCTVCQPHNVVASASLRTKQAPGGPPNHGQWIWIWIGQVREAVLQEEACTQP